MPVVRTWWILDSIVCCIVGYKLGDELGKLLGEEVGSILGGEFGYELGVLLVEKL